MIHLLAAGGDDPFRMILGIIVVVAWIISGIYKQFKDKVPQKTPSRPADASAPSVPVAPPVIPAAPTGDALRELAEQRRRQLQELARRRKQLQQEVASVPGNSSAAPSPRKAAPRPVSRPQAKPKPAPRPIAVIAPPMTAITSPALDPEARMAVHREQPGHDKVVHRHVADAPSPLRPVLRHFTRDQLRQAIILKELLEPPVSLRDFP